MITLIMASILIAGPYVIRSWHANIKSWEDSVTDSFNDPLTDCPSCVSLQGCDCLFVGDPPNTCGLGSGGVNCAPTEYLQVKNCAPAGCESTTSPPIDTTPRCVVDNLCCTTPVPTGLCGINGGCADGYMQNSYNCGSDPTIKYTCVQDIANCSFSCQGSLPPSNKGQLCPGDDVGLSNNTTNYTPVTNCSTPGGSVPKCEFKCINGFEPSGGACACISPKIEQGNTCVDQVCLGGDFYDWSGSCSSFCMSNGGTATAVGLFAAIGAQVCNNSVNAGFTSQFPSPFNNVNHTECQVAWSEQALVPGMPPVFYLATMCQCGCP